jgi:hypothetical protein
MQGYRAYIIGQDGHIHSRVDLSCENEDDAKTLALQMVGGYDVELWQLGRKIETFRGGVLVTH